nr:MULTISPECIES: hypothetical protein [unclassified Devosia]
MHIRIGLSLPVTDDTRLALERLPLQLGFHRCPLLQGMVLLLAAMLVAMPTSGGKILDPVRAAIHERTLMLNGHQHWPALGERTFAVAALAILTLSQVALYP